MDSVAPKLPLIQVPVLVAQSRGDPVVDPRGSRRIFERVGSQDKKYALFNFHRHGILLGEGASRVYNAVGSFIEHVKKNR